jgi:hypothetical protein
MHLAWAVIRVFALRVDVGKYTLMPFDDITRAQLCAGPAVARNAAVHQPTEGLREGGSDLAKSSRTWPEPDMTIIQSGPPAPSLLGLEVFIDDSQRLESSPIPRPVLREITISDVPGRQACRMAM